MGKARVSLYKRSHIGIAVASVGDVASSANSIILSRPGQKDSIELPVAKHIISNAVAGRPLLISSYRKSIVNTCRKQLGNVVGCDASASADVVRILQLISFYSEVA